MGGASCIGSSIPEHIKDCLYFFFKLGTAIETYGYKKYALPTPRHHVIFQDKGVKSVQEVRSTPRNPDAEDAEDVNSTRFSLASAFHNHHEAEEQYINQEPFSVRVGFTGAFFVSDAKIQREVFCVLYITPLRNFDMLSYITEDFLTRPKVQPKEKEWLELNSIWKTILRREANNNCGLKGDPCSHVNNPGHELGIYRITNLLSVPLRIAELISREYREVSNLNIIGCPKLTHLRDDVMRKYVKYMNELVDQHCRWQEDHCNFRRAFSELKDEEKHDAHYQLPHPGGWPIKAVPSPDGDGVMYTQFDNVFSLPMMMTWGILIPMSTFLTNRETFVINIGGIPNVAEKSIIDFNTCNLDDHHPATIPNELILKSQELATPYTQAKTFYGPNANVGAEIKTHSCMLSWWHAVLTDIQSQRRNGITTPLRAAELIENQVRISMKKHVGMLSDHSYRSDSLEQEFHTIRQISKTLMGKERMAVYVSALREEKSPFSIRHDAYMSTQSVFYTCLEDLNKDFALNSTNLELFLEMFLASIHHKLGSHNGSGFMDFFHGLLIVGGRGHLSVLGNGRNGVGVIRMDNRKQNSTGAGYSQEKLNMLKEIYGLEVGITVKDNKMLIFCHQQWTRGAIEQMSCMVTVNGILNSLPPVELNERDGVILEARDGNDLTPLVKLCFARDASSIGQIVVTTVDPNKTNERQTAQKEQITRIPILALCSNCLDDTGEQWNTMAAVLHVAAPGVSSYKSKKATKSSKFSDVGCEK